MNIIYTPFIFYYCWQNLFTFRVFSLLSSSNDASVDIVNDYSLGFLLKLNSHQPCSRDWSRIIGLRTTASVKKMLKLLPFKWLLNHLLLKTECLEFMLILWFVSVKFIRSFSKFSFLSIFIHLISEAATQRYS